MDYNKDITNITRGTLYRELYDYIQNVFDARPSTTKIVIETLPSVIESLVNETEKSNQREIK